MDENSYVKGPTDKPLVRTTLRDLLEELVRKDKSKIAIISRHEKRNITLGELVEEADHLALGLFQLGLKFGDKIGIILSNSIDMFVINLACVRGGFVSIHLNPASQEQELEYYIQITNINCIISVDEYKTFSILNILKQIISKADKSENDKQVLPLKTVIIVSKNTYRDTFNYESVKLSGKEMVQDGIKNIKKKVKSTDICTILYTSGTTGKPKIIGLTHYQLYNFYYFLFLRLGLDKEEHKMCHYMPLFHILGHAFFYSALLAGAPVVLPSFYYNPEKNLEAISDERCTILVGSPTMFMDLISVQNKTKLPISPGKAVTGAAICPDNVISGMKTILKVKDIGIIYGTTETLMVTWNWIKQDKDIPSSYIGDVVDHLEMKILDNCGNTVPLGTVGNLHVRGYSVLNNYLCHTNKIDDLDSEGWYKTGDAVYLDKDKRAHIKGRLKETINRGGEKVNPVEVEEVLETHPNILEACVVGTNHKRLGEEVCACIKIKPETSIMLNEIRDFCKDKLSYYKIPSRLEIMDSFPKTNLGKLQRLKLLNLIDSEFLKM